MHREKTPVSLVTGFLGSGKTTVLNRLLADPAMAGTAVLVNEFGEIAIDGALIAQSSDSLVELKNGCVCCSLNDDLAASLRGFMERRRSGRMPAFERVLVETTGLANAGPIVATLVRDPRVRGDYVLDRVLTTVDAVNGAANLDLHAESVEQVAVADCLVLTKLDRMAAPEGAARVRDLRQRLRALNPAAVVADGDHGRVDAGLVVRKDRAGSLARSTDPSLWDPRRGHREPGTGTHPGNGPGRHDRHIRSFCLVREAPVPLAALDRFWSAAAGEAGPNLLRVKGIVHVAGKPDTPAVLQGVQEVLDEKRWLPAWPGGDRRTRLVFIGWRIDEERIRRLWEEAEAGRV